ncbi:hypothetical protein BDN71DRAFT_1436660 [Pleurotus eryngii]|uniref:Uncharacterized protein n=1 Tax=Pleurotus eryngii TaxID=5323 RepID=A0A9P6D9I4_PLEER|nr:hypothetical protein BDN71DRAFT_1436660 [Pleurotus eryngii]
MPGARWTTSKQFKFLTSFSGAYRQAQTDGAAALAMFFSSFYEKWFLEFRIEDEDKHRKEAQREQKNAGQDSGDKDAAGTPGNGSDDTEMPAVSSLPLTDAKKQKQRGALIQKKREQLKSWFRNNCRIDTRPKSVSFVEMMIKSLAKQNETRTCTLRPIEIFSKDHYASSGTKAIVDRRTIDEKPPMIGPETKSQWKKRWIMIYNEELRRAWLAATPSIRKAVEDKALRLAKEEKEAEQAAKEENKCSGGSESLDSKLTPVQVQEYINQLPVLIPAIFNEVRKKTGWAFTVLCGGPMPMADGEIEAFRQVPDPAVLMTFDQTFEGRLNVWSNVGKKQTFEAW